MFSASFDVKGESERLCFVFPVHENCENEILVVEGFGERPGLSRASLRLLLENLSSPFAFFDLICERLSFARAPDSLILEKPQNVNGQLLEDNVKLRLSADGFRYLYRHNLDVKEQLQIAKDGESPTLFTVNFLQHIP